MEKLVLKVNDDDLSTCRYGINEKFEALMCLKRHYTSADIALNDNVEETQLMSFLERFGRKIINSKLTFIGCSSQIFVKILKNLPNLETLAVTHRRRKLLRYCPLMFANNFVERMALNKLTKLVVKGGWTALQHIEAPSLVELELPYDEQLLDFSHYHDRSTFELENLDRFLKASPKLESLNADPEFFRKMTPGFPFKLKKINWNYGSNVRCLKFNGNVAGFLLSQSATLETFEVFSEDFRVFKTVLTGDNTLKRKSGKRVDKVGKNRKVEKSEKVGTKKRWKMEKI